MWNVSKLPSAARITPCSQSLCPAPLSTNKQLHISMVSRQDCPSHSLHLACYFASFLIVLSCSDSYYGTVKLCAEESVHYLVCYAVQRNKRNSSVTDPRQILKTLRELLTRPSTIYSQCNTKQDSVCLWHIVKICSSCFLQLRKALIGSGNCSCICQAMLNQLFPPFPYSFGLTESRENTAHGNRNRNVWMCLVGWSSVITLQCLLSAKIPLLPRQSHRLWFQGISLGPALQMWLQLSSWSIAAQLWIMYVMPRQS